MLKLFKRNRNEYINIWIKKSVIKIDKKKSTLLEFVTPSTHFFLFVNRELFFTIKSNPVSIFDELNKHNEINDVYTKALLDGFFYCNGEKVELYKNN